MTTTTVNVSDMFCSNCSGKIVTALQERPGVNDIQVNPIKKDLFISHDQSISAAELMEDIQSLGFNPKLEQSTLLGDTDNSLLRRLGVAGICAMQVMMIHIGLYAGFFQGMDPSIYQLLSLAALIFCIPLICYSAVPFFQRGLLGLWQRPKWSSINMDTPIALAIMLAFAISATNTMRGSGEVFFDSVAMFTFLMLGARYLDHRLRAKLHVADAVADSLPKTVQQWPSMQITQLESVRPGDELWISEGAQLPVDGISEEHAITLDCTLLSGESEPRKVESGETAYAGTINTGPGFVLRATAVANATRVAAIDRIASQAASRKNIASGIADKVAKLFVPAILLTAAATALFWHVMGGVDPIGAMLAVLVISCPCALSLATPAAINAALTNLRQKGLLLRNSSILENASLLKHVVFDKTGTLTSPALSIDREQAHNTLSLAECLALMGTLERHSSHPVARPFKRFDTARPVTSVSTRRNGITGWIDGECYKAGNASYCNVSKNFDNADVYLVCGEKLLASFSLGRQLREDAADTIKALKDQRLHVHLLSGDQHIHCEAIAKQLDISFKAEKEPEAKQQYINQLGGTLYVGDGLNDLPALAAADASMATMETIDLVKSRADGLFMTDKLQVIVAFFHVAQACSRVIRQNLAWAVAYNCIAIPIAASGLATPWIAALGMSLSSLLVMLNSTRLLRTE